MSAKKRVIRAAMKLSKKERLEVASLLYESVEGPGSARTDEEWDQEIERRIKAADAGETKAISWQEARRQMSAH
jgi:putative addiction module component (TIGR02574 family)